MSQVLFVTWALAGVMPVCKRTHGFRSDGTVFAMRDFELDKADSGPRWLGQTDIAQKVRDVMLFGEDRGDYKLGAWVIMPNHVHILVCPERPLWAIMREIKSGSARIANRILEQEGKTFWQREYYHRIVRDSAEEARITAYIEQNPVRAGLCQRAEDWMHGSAHEISRHRPWAGITQPALPSDSAPVAAHHPA